MKNLFSYKDFLGEAKKSTTPLSLFKKDVDGIISDMFLQAKKQKYEYDSDGFPTSVEFEVVYNDWFCKYDGELKNEFTEGVLKKRDFQPVFVYSSKDQEGKDKDTSKNTYTLKFKIKKEKVDPEELAKGEEKKRAEQFEKDSDDQLLKKLKSKKISDANKEKVMNILKDRGVDYKNPFDEDEDADMSEEEMTKQAEKEAKEKAAKKKNESYQLNESAMSTASVIAQESDSFEDFKIGMRKEFPDLFRSMSNESQIEIDDWLNTLYDSAKIDDQQDEMLDKDHLTEAKKEEKCKCGKGEKGKCECEVEKCECGKSECKKCNESINEGLIGKIAKILSKAEYEKAVKHVIGHCKTEDKCTKENVKEALKGMIFNKINKKAFEEDGKLMKSLTDEIHKEAKRRLSVSEYTKDLDNPARESFGSKEWQEKYGVNIKEEKEEVCLNCLVNETLKIKKVEDMENLNDVFNKVYEDNKVVENLEPIRKFSEKKDN
jgi:hypothetical protein